jgi:hypothetical protein
MIFIVTPFLNIFVSFRSKNAIGGTAMTILEGINELTEADWGKVLSAVKSYIPGLQQKQETIDDLVDPKVWDKAYAAKRGLFMQYDPSSWDDTSRSALAAIIEYVKIYMDEGQKKRFDTLFADKETRKALLKQISDKITQRSGNVHAYKGANEEFEKKLDQALFA